MARGVAKKAAKRAAKKRSVKRAARKLDPSSVVREGELPRRRGRKR